METAAFILAQCLRGNRNEEVGMKRHVRHSQPTDAGPKRLLCPRKLMTVCSISILLVSEQRSTLQAGPVGATVVAGQATIGQQGNLTTVQAANNSIINYRSFDILAHETVQFIQPDSSARVLNRVLDAAPTSILGNLLANGQVYIVNPSGIYFGKDSYVNVGGLVAVAGNLSNPDFLNHVDHFTDVKGDLSNLGTITAGSVTLAGQHVANYGTISAPDGLVTLLAGDDILLGENGGKVFVNLGKASPSDKAGVENAGTINAGAGIFHSCFIRR